MPDPKQSYGQRNAPIQGAGPYQFQVGGDFGTGDLPPGETATLDLREYEENGTVGYYVVISESGYNSVQIRNDASESLQVQVNETWNFDVPPSTIQTLEQEGMYRFTVKNLGDINPVAAQDVTLTITREAYGADAKARREAESPAWRNMLRNQLGI